MGAAASQKWSPRFAAFAAAHALTPKEAQDDMGQALKVRKAPIFVVWISEKWAEFCKAFDRDREALTGQDHADFDAWLAASVERQAATAPAQDATVQLGVGQMAAVDETSDWAAGARA